MSEDFSGWMRLALGEAALAAAQGEVPVGCVVLDAEGRPLARGRNLREALEDPTAHAEMIAVRAASERVGSWRLDGATAVVTLEPCPMCAGALVLARVARVVWGCDDPKGGGVVSRYGIGVDPALNHRFEVVRGVLEGECAEALRAFFRGRRAEKREARRRC
ncbi:MAG: nucleoside deaminase [Polyangiales bacterium]